MLVQTISALDDLRISLFVDEEHCFLEEEPMAITLQNNKVCSVQIVTSTLYASLDDLYL